MNNMNMESEVREIFLDDIIPNRFQPRLSFDEKAMGELAASIKEHGVIQPLVLRRLGDDKYEIIAGERRYKASKMAGLTKVPAVIANLDDNQSAEVALVENIQRKDLTPIEEAKSYKNLLDRGYLTQEQLAQRLGVSQPVISNKMRLLNLSNEVQDALLKEQISERHARSLLQLQDQNIQNQLLNKTLTERLTVKQLDDLIRKDYLNSETSEEDDIPLVDLVPNINNIKNNSVDISQILDKQPAPSPTMNEFMINNEVEPAPVVEPKEESNTNKFFNFLEEEGANMQTEEPKNSSIQTEPVVETQSTSLDNISQVNQPGLVPNVSTIPVAEPLNTNQGFNFFDTAIPENANTIAPQVEPAPVENNNITPALPEISIQAVPSEVPTASPVIEQPSNEVPTASPVVEQPSNEGPTVNPAIEQPPIIQSPLPIIENMVDPVNMIDSINEVKQQEEKIELQEKNITQAISIIRDAKSKIENLGFIVDLEEMDLDTQYQVSFKIEKD